MPLQTAQLLGCVDNDVKQKLIPLCLMGSFYATPGLVHNGKLLHQSWRCVHNEDTLRRGLYGVKPPCVYALFFTTTKFNLRQCRVYHDTIKEEKIRLGAYGLNTLTSKNAFCRSRPQKLSATISRRAPSSQLAVLYLSYSPPQWLQGWFDPNTMASFSGQLCRYVTKFVVPNRREATTGTAQGVLNGELFSTDTV